MKTTFVREFTNTYVIDLSHINLKRKQQAQAIQHEKNVRRGIWSYSK